MGKCAQPCLQTLFITGLVLILVSSAGCIHAANRLDVGSTWNRPSDGMIMLFVPAGEFSMGSEFNTSDDAILFVGGFVQNRKSDEVPVHTVHLDGYWIDQTEVTNAMYALCVSSGACEPPASTRSSLRENYYDSADYADYPVVHVTWQNAQSYCAWVGGRLPTEAEWEKAARGGLQELLYPWGDDSPTCEPGAANGALSSKCNQGDTAAVSSFGPNGYGLYDMAGNVSEWVADWYDENYYEFSPTGNPAGPETGTQRVIRGGSYNGQLSVLRTAKRGQLEPVFEYGTIGFRCAASDLSP